MEFIGKGVLDVRILHRFGLINTGFSNLWGLDQASMRFGFDYGVTKNFTVGIGRSTAGKEWDGFLKYRLVQQSVGGKNPSPVSVVLITGATISSAPWEFPDRKNYFSSRMGFYNEVIVGRKFNDKFSAQLAPTHVCKTNMSAGAKLCVIIVTSAHAARSCIPTHRRALRLHHLAVYGISLRESGQ